MSTQSSIYNILHNVYESLFLPVIKRSKTTIIFAVMRTDLGTLPSSPYAMRFGVQFVTIMIYYQNSECIESTISFVFHTPKPQHHTT